jgi:hypothetical protein
VLIEIFAIHNVLVFLQYYESDVQLLPSPLFWECRFTYGFVVCI